MKKSVTILGLVSLCLMFGGCGNAGSSDTSEKETLSIYSRGLEIVEILENEAKDENYSKVLSGSDEIAKIGEEIAKGDYSEPTAVYEISFDDDKLLEFVNAYEEAGDFSDNIKETMKKRVRSSLPTLVNRSGGVEYVAASGVYTANSLFVSKELENDRILLYIFKDTYPVSVNFSKGEDNAVSANGMFLFDKDINGMSKEEIEKSFEEKIPIDFTLREVTN